MAVRIPCLDCGDLTTRTSSGAQLCASCLKARERSRNAKRRHYKGGWPKLSRQVRAVQPYCSECGATGKLEVDHVEPRSLASGVRVLCRACHQRKTNADRTKSLAIANPLNPSQQNFHSREGGR